MCSENGLQRFCRYNSPCSHAVKTTVVTDNEFRNTIVNNMAFHRLCKLWKDFLGGFPVANKEAAFQNNHLFQY